MLTVLLELGEVVVERTHAHARSVVESIQYRERKCATRGAIPQDKL